MRVNRQPKGTPVASQDMVDKGKWSKDRQLLWSNDKAGQALVLDLPVDDTRKVRDQGQASPRARAMPKSSSRSMRKARSSRGQRIQFYNPELKPTGLFSLGTLELDQRKHRVTITVFGKDPKSNGFDFGLDEIQLVPVKVELPFACRRSCSGIGNLPARGEVSLIPGTRLRGVKIESTSIMTNSSAWGHRTVPSFGVRRPRSNHAYSGLESCLAERSSGGTPLEILDGPRDEKRSA